ncbi:ubiquitin-like protein ISG15 [Diadema antillarum]|uniref:ubiquitin-like protein ISG15 n=1 Tax=Diadema antillarum TaxID=105358 RepID=UPI003A8B6BC8
MSSNKKHPPGGNRGNEPDRKRPVPIRINNAGRTTTVDVDLGTSQDQFLDIVSDHLDIARRQMYLTFESKPLSGMASLADAGIKENGTVHVNMRLRGG